MRDLLSMSEEEQLSLIKKRFQESETYTKDWRDEASELYSLIAGQQWSDEDKAKMEAQRRPAVTFNVAGKYIDAVAGLQVTNRQEVKYLPREPGDTGVNELLTGAAEWARDQADAEDEESEAFVDLVTCGMGWVEGEISLDENPDGEWNQERRDPLEMYWDPRARKRNLRDRRWQIRVKRMTEEDIIERWGEDAYQDMTGDMGVEPDFANLGIHNADEAWKYEHDATDPYADGTIPVLDYQQYEMTNMIQVTTKFGERKFTPAQWRKMKEVLTQNGVPYQMKRIRDRKYIRIFAGGNVVLEAAESPYQEGFTYQAITGKRDRNKNCWYGIGRAIKDPQLWTNKLFSTILHAMASGAKGGLLAEEDAFADPARAEEEWATPDAITWLESGAIAAGKIQEKTPATYPAGLDRLMQFAIGLLPETSGLNMEIIGMSNKVQAGVVEAQRKQSAMTVIAWCFDGMRRYYKDHARQLAYYLREYIADGRLARISGKQGAKYIPLVKDQLTMQYDVVVDEAPTSANVKERVWLMLEGLLPMLLKMNMPIPPEVLDYSPLPEDLQNSWKKLLQPDPKQQQAQQQQQQLDAQEQQATIAKDQSVADLNKAKARREAAETGKTAAGG